MTTQKWIKVLTRKGATPLFVSLIARGYNRDCFKFLHDFDVELREKYDGDVYFEAEGLSRLTQLIKNCIAERKLATFLKPVYEQCEKLLQLGDQLAELNPEEMNELELKGWFSLYVGTAVKLNLTMSSIPIADLVLEQEIAGELNKIMDEEKVVEYLSILIYPKKDNLYALAMRELVELAAEIQKAPELLNLFEKPSNEIRQELAPELLTKIAKHAEKYAFFGMEYYDGEPLSVDDTISSIKELLKEDCEAKLARMRQEKEDAACRYKRALEELDISEDLLQLIEFAQEVFYLRQHRADALFKAGFCARGLLTELAKRAGLGYEDIIHLTYAEALDLINEKPISVDEINKRKLGFVWRTIDGKTEVITDGNNRQNSV